MYGWNLTKWYERRRESDKEQIIFTYLNTEKSFASGFLVRNQHYILFFSPSKKWGLPLSQTITLVKLVFKTARHFPQCNWKFYLSQSFSMVNERRDKGSQLGAIFRCWKLEYYNKFYKTNLVKYIFCLLFLPIFIFFSCLHLSLEDELLTRASFSFNFPVFSLIPARTSTQAIKWIPFNLFWNTSELSRNKKTLNHSRLKPQGKSLTQETLLSFPFYQDYTWDHSSFCLFPLMFDIYFQRVFEAASLGKDDNG